MPITINQLFEEDFKPAWLIAEEKEKKDIETDFLIFTFNLRFGEMESCQKCEKPNRYHLLKNRKCFSCAWCAYQIYPLARTSLEKTTTPIKYWLEACQLLKEPISAKSLERKFNVTYKTAWRMKKVILEDFKNKLLLYTFTYKDFSNIGELAIRYKFQPVNKR